MVLTAVDYQKEKELFSQMKIALRNFFFALSKEVVLDTEAWSKFHELEIEPWIEQQHWL